MPLKRTPIHKLPSFKTWFLKKCAAQPLPSVPPWAFRSSSRNPKRRAHPETTDAERLGAGGPSGSSVKERPQPKRWTKQVQDLLDLSGFNVDWFRSMGFCSAKNQIQSKTMGRSLKHLAKSLEVWMYMDVLLKPRRRGWLIGPSWMIQRFRGNFCGPTM